MTEDNEQTVSFILSQIKDVMIWAKDLKGKFTYVNEVFCTDFLGTEDINEPLGKTGSVLTNLQGEGFTFADVCRQTDEIVLITKMPTATIESGLIKGIQKTCAIYKWPLLNPDLIGSIGLAFFIEGEGGSDGD